MLWRHFDAHLYGPGTVPVRPGPRAGPYGLPSGQQAERHSAERGHDLQVGALASRSGAEPAQALRPGDQVGHFGVEVDPRSMITDLLVDVRVALGCHEAAELRVGRKRLTKRPAQGPAPERAIGSGRFRRNVVISATSQRR